MYLLLWVLVCVRDRERERKRWPLLPGQPFPVSSLTLSPQRLLVTFCLFCMAAISHSLMSYHSICPSPYFHAALARSLTLSPDLWDTQSQLQFDYSSSWQHTCHFVCTHLLVNSESLCAREQFVLKFVLGGNCFTLTKTWNLGAQDSDWLPRMNKCANCDGRRYLLKVAVGTLFSDDCKWLEDNLSYRFEE